MVSEVICCFNSLLTNICFQVSNVCFPLSNVGYSIVQYNFSVVYGWFSIDQCHFSIVQCQFFIFLSWFSILQISLFHCSMLDFRKSWIDCKFRERVKLTLKSEKDSNWLSIRKKSQITYQFWDEGKLKKIFKHFLSSGLLHTSGGGRGL